MTAGRVLFVGCGPGAADLLTLRAVHALQTADIVIWNADLLDRRALTEHTRADSEILQWPPATQRDIQDAFDRACVEDLLVVRLKGGDPTLLGALEPELSAVRERGLACEIVPGISALSAGAAALGREIATHDAALLVGAASALAGDHTTATVVASYGVDRDPRALQRTLLTRGLAAATPCTVAIEVSRRDEMLLSCVLEDLAETVEDAAMGALAIVFAGLPEAQCELPCKD